MTSRPTTAILLAGLGAVLFSTKAILVKLCYRYGADTVTVLALRMIFALPFFWAAVLWQRLRRRPGPMTARDRATVAALGFVGYYVASFLDFLSLRYISVGLERIILYLNPTLVLLISAVLFARRVSGRQWAAMAVAYAGVTLVFLHDVRIDGSGAAVGGALVFLGAVAYAVYLVFSGEIVERVGSVRLVAYASTSAAFFCVLQSVVLNPQGLVGQQPVVYALSVLNAGLCTFLPMLLTMAAVRRVGSGLASQASVLGPVATVFLGWLFLGEPVGVLQIAGIAVVIASVWMLLEVAREAGGSSASG